MRETYSKRATSQGYNKNYNNRGSISSVLSIEISKLTHFTRLWISLIIFSTSLSLFAGKQNWINAILLPQRRSPDDTTTSSLWHSSISARSKDDGWVLWENLLHSLMKQNAEHLHAKVDEKTSERFESNSPSSEGRVEWGCYVELLSFSSAFSW
jgi:hypothetical protein